MTMTKKQKTDQATEITTIAKNKKNTVVLPTTLKVILESQRPCSGDKTEAPWLQQFILNHNIIVDKYKNMYVQVGASEDHSWVFTSHLDTVENKRDLEKQKKLVMTGDILGVQGGGILGADDGAGIWLMCEMINSNVPGTYVFFQDEEMGRLGSEDAKKRSVLAWDRFDFMISLDRMGTTDIVDHQMGERCCSPTFVKGLGKLLGMGHTGADGSYTDSYTFADTIPECTNLSVGYYAQHSKQECLDVKHIIELRDKLISVDWSSLVKHCERDPQVIEADWWDTYGVSNDPDYKYSSWVNNDIAEKYPNLVEMAEYELENWVYINPTEAAAILFDVLNS